MRILIRVLGPRGQRATRMAGCLHLLYLRVGLAFPWIVPLAAPLPMLAADTSTDTILGTCSVSGGSGGTIRGKATRQGANPRNQTAGILYVPPSPSPKARSSRAPKINCAVAFSVTSKSSFARAPTEHLCLPVVETGTRRVIYRYMIKCRSSSGVRNEERRGG